MKFYNFLLQNETYVRLTFFFGILTIIAVWEFFSPRRKLNESKLLRWVNNLGLVVFNSFISKLVFPIAAVGIAHEAANSDWGILHYLPISYWQGVFISIILLDLVIYIQHVMFHSLPLLWRLHRVHHADLDYDVTTGARFHTIEILLSMIIKFIAIVLIGAPATGVIMFEIILNGMAMFNHGNIRLPSKIDSFIRTIFVTPDMHRVHHSILADETNSNFGFNLSIWDKTFGTYKKEPDKGHENMTIGIDLYRDRKECTFITGMLMMPFYKNTGEYPINRRYKKEN